LIKLILRLVNFITQQSISQALSAWKKFKRCEISLVQQTSQVSYVVKLARDAVDINIAKSCACNNASKERRVLHHLLGRRWHYNNSCSWRLCTSLLIPLREGACESEATEWNAPSLSKNWLHHKAKHRGFKDFPIATSIGHYGATRKGRTYPSKTKGFIVHTPSVQPWCPWVRPKNRYEETWLKHIHTKNGDGRSCISVITSLAL
jgi:hypothetical protein